MQIFAQRSNEPSLPPPAILHASVTALDLRLSILKSSCIPISRIYVIATRELACITVSPESIMAGHKAKAGGLFCTPRGKTTNTLAAIQTDPSFDKQNRLSHIHQISVGDFTVQKNKLVQKSNIPGFNSKLMEMEKEKRNCSHRSLQSTIDLWRRRRKVFNSTEEEEVMAIGQQQRWRYGCCGGGSRDGLKEGEGMVCMIEKEGVQESGGTERSCVPGSIETRVNPCGGMAHKRRRHSSKCVYVNDPCTARRAILRAVQMRTFIGFENGGTNLGYLFHFAADQFSVAGALPPAQHI
ncbi:hypothetical protein LXL04_015944 [Taraxacum kok-saghyz]